MFPFVENAFKHGLNSTINNLWLKISITINDGVLLFDISNSKGVTVLKKSNSEKIGGIGITNTQKRLSILYPQKHELIINDMQNSYEVIMKLNLIYNGNKN